MFQYCLLIKIFPFFSLISCNTGSTKVYKLLIKTINEVKSKPENEPSLKPHKRDQDCSIHYVTGQRGSRKIVCDGFSYICAKINRDRKYWVCAKQRSRNCKARLITNADETLFIQRNQYHNHKSESSASRSD